MLCKEHILNSYKIVKCFQATDADIGENAELLYWSSEPVLAVAPTTGFVHVRDGVQLEDGSRLTVNATDRNGEGLSGSLDILVCR